MGIFHLTKSFAQFIAVLFSLLTNSVMIVLVMQKSPKKIGNYKYLMCYFCAMSMIYAILDYIVQPYLYCYGSSFSMIMDLRDSIFGNFRTTAFFLTASMAACFGISIYAIAINFIYRYFAIERQGGMRYFAGRRLVFWLLIPISVGAMWLSVGWFSLGYDQQLVDYLRIGINKSYDLDADQITLTGCMYFRPDEYGEPRWCMEDAVGAFILCNLMNVPFCVICYFGYKSHRKINSLISNGESNFARRLQKQLHYALLAQTAIPLVFLFFPIGALFTAPLIGLNLEKGSILVTFFYTFYPVVDPLPTLIFVDEYREALLSMLNQLEIKMRQTFRLLPANNESESDGIRGVV